jgi:hypothetical protein
MIQLKNQKLCISIPSKSHLFHHVIHLVRIHYTRTSVLLRHTFGNTLHRVICRLTPTFFEVGGVVISQPHQMFRTRVYLTISTSVLKGQSDSNLTCVDIVFETRTDPHRHGMFRMCGTIPSPFPILRIGCVFLDVLLLVRKEPRSVQHLTNLQLNLDNMLVT